MATSVTLTTDSGVTFEGTMTPDPQTPSNGFALPAQTVASALPTTDPHVVGRLWASSGVLTVSAG